MISGQDAHLFHVSNILGVQCSLFNTGVLWKGTAPGMATARCLQDPFPWR